MDELDRSIEEAGKAIGKTPQEIKDAQRNAHDAVDHGMPEPLIEQAMEAITEMADESRTRPKDRPGFGDEPTQAHHEGAERHRRERARRNDGEGLC